MEILRTFGTLASSFKSFVIWEVEARKLLRQIKKIPIRRKTNGGKMTNYPIRMVKLRTNTEVILLGRSPNFPSTLLHLQARYVFFPLPSCLDPGRWVVCLSRARTQRTWAYCYLEPEPARIIYISILYNPSLNAHSHALQPSQSLENTPLHYSVQ